MASPLPNDANDPTRDEDGCDLSICWGLRERLERIDDAYRALPVRERSPTVLRQLSLQILGAVSELADHRSPVLDHLVEGLRLADAGKRHPIFAVGPSDPISPRPAQSIAAIQGAAAGALEYAYSDLGQVQLTAAKKIAEVLAASGLSQSNDGAPYSGDCVVKWRAQCIKGRHAGAREYDEMLGLLRSHASTGWGLGLLQLMCEHFALAPRT